MEMPSRPLIIERTRPKSKAEKKPSTLNPGTMALESMTITAEITRLNRPKVKTLIGKVRKLSTGRTKALTAAKIMAATMAAKRPSTWTPGMM